MPFHHHLVATLNTIGTVFLVIGVGLIFGVCVMDWMDWRRGIADM